MEGSILGSSSRPSLPHMLSGYECGTWPEVEHCMKVLMNQKMVVSQESNLNHHCIFQFSPPEIRFTQIPLSRPMMHGLLTNPIHRERMALWLLPFRANKNFLSGLEYVIGRCSCGCQGMGCIWFLHKISSKMVMEWNEVAILWVANIHVQMCTYDAWLSENRAWHSSGSTCVEHYMSIVPGLWSTRPHLCSHPWSKQSLPSFLIWSVLTGRSIWEQWLPIRSHRSRW